MDKLLMQEWKAPVKEKVGRVIWGASIYLPHKTHFYCTWPSVSLERDVSAHGGNDPNTIFKIPSSQNCIFHFPFVSFYLVNHGGISNPQMLRSPKTACSTSFFKSASSPSISSQYLGKYLWNYSEEKLDRCLLHLLTVELQDPWSWQPSLLCLNASWGAGTASWGAGNWVSHHKFPVQELSFAFC